MDRPPAPVTSSADGNTPWLCFQHLGQGQRKHPILQLRRDLLAINFAGQAECAHIVANVVFRVDWLHAFVLGEVDLPFNAQHLKAGVRLPLLVATSQDDARPMRPRIRGTSMIDQHGKTELLIARLKESLPIEANITPPLAKLLAEKSPETPIPTKCNVISVFYTGDTGGITCGLDIGGPHTKPSFPLADTRKWRNSGKNGVIRLVNVVM